MKIGDGMSRLYNDKFADIIRAKINAGEFRTKEDLIKYMQNINMVFYNDPELMRQIKDAGISLKYEDINALTRDLLAYYDQKGTDLSSLNLDGVSQVEIDGQDYIKIRREDGTHELLDDSMNNDNFVRQFQDRQNTSYNYQTNNGVKNRDEIIKDMKKDKPEVRLSSSTNVNTRELTSEERQEFAAVMGMPTASEINFVVDPIRNIYINKDTGELFYAHRNKEGKLEVRKAEETTTTTVQHEVEVMEPSGDEITVTVEQPTEPNFENMDDYELQHIADNRLDSLTPEQKEALFRLLEKRKERARAQEQQTKTQEEKGYQKIILMNVLNKPHNGFTSILYLSMMTLLFGVAAILYLTLKIYV